MKPHDELEEWEQKLHRELDTLPELDAPATLIPGVLDRIRATEALPWYRAAWWQWPAAVRAASVGLAVLVLAGLGWLSGTFGGFDLGSQFLQAWGEFREAVAAAVDAGGRVLGSFAYFWQEHGQMLLLAVAAFLAATYLTCVAAGTALYQLAWKRT
jgi:hypothetical protein